MKGDLKQIIFLCIAFFLMLRWPSLVAELQIATQDKNSTLIAVLIAAIGSAAGALGGAWIIERNQNRKNLLEELRNTNAAIMAAFHVFSSALSRKKREIIPILENFEEQEALLKSGVQGNPGVFKPNLDSLEEFAMNLDTLEDILFRRLNLNAKALASYSELAKFSSLLGAAIVRRNNIIDKWRLKSFEEVVIEFFGMNAHEKNIRKGDHTFPKNLDAMHSYVDDCIFYSMLLCKELMLHGKKLQERLSTDDDIKSINIKFEDTDAKLIPKRPEHESWLSQFV